MPSGELFSRTVVTQVAMMMARSATASSHRPCSIPAPAAGSRAGRFFQALHHRPQPRRCRVHTFRPLTRHPPGELKIFLAQQIAPNRVCPCRDFFQITGRAADAGDCQGEIPRVRRGNRFRAGENRFAVRPPPNAGRPAKRVLNGSICARRAIFVQGAFHSDAYRRSRRGQFFKPPFKIRCQQRGRPGIVRIHRFHRPQTQPVPTLDQFAARVGDFHVIDKIISFAETLFRAWTNRTPVGLRKMTTRPMLFGKILRCGIQA